MLAISIVLYQNGNEIYDAIQCVLKTNVKLKLFLVDNSPTDSLRSLASDPRIDYLFNNANLGYGAAHNIALTRSIQQGFLYHLVMNPDITFSESTLEKLIAYMDQDQEVGLAMPMVLDQFGQLQRLCKLLPTPFNLIGRRFFSTSKWSVTRNSSYELSHFDYKHLMNIPCLSGCFMFLRVSALKHVGLFDPRFFMYLEDYDLCRRIHESYKTMYCPIVSVTHLHQKASYKSNRLLATHALSGIKYFNKWGWFFDNQRRRFNNNVLRTIKNIS